MDRSRSNSPVAPGSTVIPKITTAGSDRSSHSGTRLITTFSGRSVTPSASSTVSYDPSDVTVDYSHFASALGTKRPAPEGSFAHFTGEASRARSSHYFDDDSALLRADLAATRDGVPAYRRDRRSDTDATETISYTDMTESELAMPCVDEIKRLSVEIESKLNISALYSILVNEAYKCDIDRKYADLFERLTGDHSTRTQKLNELMNHVKKDETLARCVINAVFREKGHLGHNELRERLKEHGFGLSLSLASVSTAPVFTTTDPRRYGSRDHFPVANDPIYPRPRSRPRPPAVIKVDQVYPRSAHPGTPHQSHASPSTGSEFSSLKSTYSDRLGWLRSNAVHIRNTLGKSPVLSKEFVRRLRDEKLLTPDEYERLNLAGQTSANRTDAIQTRLPGKGSEMPARLLTALYKMATDERSSEDQLNNEDKDKLHEIMKVLCHSAKGPLKEDVLSVWRKIRLFVARTNFGF